MTLPTTEEDFEAEHDLRVLTEAKTIKGDHGRTTRAREFAERKAEELKEMARALPKPQQRSRFNGARRS